MRALVRDVVGIVVLALGVGTVYIAATGKLEFWVRPERYPEALVCGPAANERNLTEGKASPAAGGRAQTPGSPETKTPSGKDSATPGGQSEGTASRTDLAEPKASETAEGPLSKVRMIDFKEVVQAWRDGLLFIDARSREAYREGHIPGAISIPAWEPGLEEKIQRLAEQGAAGEPVIVYCNQARECEDSKIVASNLVQFGFADVSVYEGGVGQWAVEKKMPLVKGENPGPRGHQYQGDGPQDQEGEKQE